MLQKLNAFIEVAKQQSFTKAAEVLYISQPALSKQMRKLEDELGFSLFNRDSYGVELTEKGRGMVEERPAIWAFSSNGKTIPIS